MRKVTILSVVLMLLGGVASADIIGTLVAADASNTSPSSALTTADAQDNLWHLTSEAAHGSGTAGTAYQSSDGEDCLEVAVTAYGLDAGQSYAVYGMFWSWNETIGINLGLQSGNLSYYNMNSAEAINTGVGPWDGSHLYQVLLGTVSGVSSIAVYANDDDSIETDNRSYLVGLAYDAVPEPMTMSLLTVGGLGVLIRKKR